MSVWIDNSKKNLLPLSKEKVDFNTAVREWYFTGNLFDHETSVEICQLCEKEGVRYHFEISNELGSLLWVGSKCIDKFDIAIYDENHNEVVKGKEAYLINKIKKKHAYQVISQLANLPVSGKIVGLDGSEYYKKELDIYCFGKYNKGEGVHARMLNYLFMRFEEEGLKYDPKAFSISLRSENGKQKLLQLANFQFDRVAKALSKSQQQYYKDNKVVNGS